MDNSESTSSRTRSHHFLLWFLGYRMGLPEYHTPDLKDPATIQCMTDVLDRLAKGEVIRGRHNNVLSVGIIDEMIRLQPDNALQFDRQLAKLDPLHAAPLLELIKREILPGFIRLDLRQGQNEAEFISSTIPGWFPNPISLECLQAWATLIGCKTGGSGAHRCVIAVGDRARYLAMTWHKWTGGDATIEIAYLKPSGLRAKGR